jgi:hypothetical protein
MPSGLLTAPVLSTILYNVLSTYYLLIIHCIIYLLYTVLSVVLSTYYLLYYLLTANISNTLQYKLHTTG